MKIKAGFLAVATLVGANLNAAPFAALGDNAELFLTASASVTIDDNIYLRNTNEVDDMIFTFTPGLDLVFGRNAQLSGNVYYRHKILRYSDVSQQNTDLLSVGFNSLYDNGKTKFDVGVNYAENAQNEISAPGFIVASNTMSFRALSEFGLSQKTTFGVGLRYDETDYSVVGAFRNNNIWTLPVDLYFEATPKMQVSVGYRYRATDLAGNGIDNVDHFLNVGARGEFTPKLVGQVRVGYNKRNFERTLADVSNLGVDASLSYAYSAKSTFNLAVSNDFGNSANGDSTESLAITVGGRVKLDEQWSWDASLAFRSIEYPTRSDDFFEGNVGFRYSYSAFLDFTGSYTHRKLSSSRALFEFANNVFFVGANIRY